MTEQLMDKRVGREVLLELSVILDVCGIPFYLLHGTALGAYRDNGFVPAEKDIDLGILYEDLHEKVPMLLSALRKNKFNYETFVKPFNHPRIIVVSKRNVHADLVSLFRWKDYRVDHTPISTNFEPFCFVHKARLVENYQDVKMFGRTFRIPSPIEEYLQDEYGPNWRTPTDSFEHFNKVYDFLENEGVPADWLDQYN